jgi:DNA repair exonuclease SbcCD ATPase subunit
MATGYQTLQNIEHAISQIRAREEELTRAMQADNETRTALMRERARLLRQFAELRTKSAVADGVIDEADRLENDVAMILASRQKTIADIEARHRRAEARRKEILESSKAQHSQIAALEAELDQLAEEARRSLTSNAEYLAAVARRDTLAQQQGRAASKARQAEADRQRKGAPYESDPLFMYLWKRNYRGRDPNAAAIVRALDEWVAKLCGYNTARANYAMLIEIPTRLKEHAERLAKERDAAAARASEIEARRMTELAGTDLPGRLAAARAKHKEIDASLSAVETELSEAANLLNRYAEGSDDSFKLAVDTLSAFLDRQRYDLLMDEARATAEPSDDELAVRIAETMRKAEAIERQVRERRGELDKLASRREELVRVVADFRRKSYHEPGSIFEPDMDLDDMLEAVIKGILTGAEYWARTRQRQRWNGRAADPFRRSSGFPPFDFGRGRGGSRRRDDDDDDDFRTRGGF